MAIANNVKSFNNSEIAQPVASIQPVSFNGINFKKTNLYANNDAHMGIVKFAETKAAKENQVADDKGIKLVDVNGMYAVRLYGDKPNLNTTEFVDLF